MNNLFLIPLANFPQSFQITLAGVNYIFTVKWNDAFEAGWEFDLANADTNESIVAGIPMITGADCLSGLDYLGIEGQIYVYTDGDATAVPNYTNLGSASNLYFLTAVANG